MPHNNDTTLIIPAEADVQGMTPADLFTAKYEAERAQQIASHLAVRVMRASARINDSAVGDIESAAHDMAELTYELAAQNAALAAMLQESLRQRDDALRGRAGWYEDILSRLADAQGCSKAEAAKLMIALLNPDEQLMADDVVAASDTLDQVRYQIAQVIDWLNEDLLVDPEDV